ncbi:hypothetical protein PoB_001606900 [Plakobranchus ocellatus]|uniref:Uncharacterized protein n=1 Tax=Plakobranchus ocellatus TaxID=259542 RepID=A0AAV3Z2L1_9GAST|nr:hypothetical protein PoB_001606900 [Plakobranchus ocellatus]
MWQGKGDEMERRGKRRKTEGEREQEVEEREAQKLRKRRSEKICPRPRLRFLPDSGLVSVYSQKRDLSLSGPTSDIGADGGARTRKVPADLKVDSLSTVSPRLHQIQRRVTFMPMLLDGLRSL